MKRILIVDDALELGRMLRAAVETLGAGLEVKLFPSAEEALMETAHLQLDLLIADIRLPGISGLDLARRLRERSSEIKILLITGLTAKDLDAKAGAAGADRFLRKPFLMSEFMAAASELLGLHQPESAQSQAGPAAEEPPAPAIDLSGVLQRVRKGLGAALVLLADERGRVVAQTGERTDFEFEKQWAPAVLAALNAAQKASRLVTSGIPQGALVLRGNELQLILAPVGDYAFVIVLGPDARMLRSALALEEALTAQAQLVRILDGMGVDFRAVTAISAPPAEVIPPPAAKPPVKSPAVVKPAAAADIPSKPLHKAAKPAAEKKSELSAEPVEAPRPEALPAPGLAPVDEPVGPFTDYSEAALEGLGEVFEKPEQAVDPQKADEFWEQGLADMTGAVESPDGLTYDQAHQLGLTPDPN
ncbi:MAG: response regulator transcription factor [Bellilinea sp.]